jgi:hypothetical protein
MLPTLLNQNESYYMESQGSTSMDCFTVLMAEIFGIVKKLTLESLS